jgi:hypothetical protein
MQRKKTKKQEIPSKYSEAPGPRPCPAARPGWGTPDYLPPFPAVETLAGKSEHCVSLQLAGGLGEIPDCPILDNPMMRPKLRVLHVSLETLSPHTQTLPALLFAGHEIHTDFLEYSFLYHFFNFLGLFLQVST